MEYNNRTYGLDTFGTINSSAKSLDQVIANARQSLDAVSGPSFSLDESQARPGGSSLLGIITGANKFAQDDVPTNSADIWHSSPSTPQQIQYFDAPYAEKYGMSAETAYQEALANTAYQRKVADLKAAGLNPVLGISGSGAGSFPGQLASGFSFGSVGSGSTLSGIAGKLSYALPQFLNGLVNLVVTAKTGNSMSGYGAGFVAQNISSGVLNYIKNTD